MISEGKYARQHVQSRNNNIVIPRRSFRIIRKKAKIIEKVNKTYSQKFCLIAN